jgi:hypothetical protein
MTAVEVTVTMPLVELARLQGYERRAHACLNMRKADLGLSDEERADTYARIGASWPGYEPPSMEEQAIGRRLDRYASQFVSYVVNEAL